ncbi:unnamed protein product [Oikopleura dioica]|uniref:inositol-phosphate phosphatase n=1 Tax=Oikopleura dioica TaxID=34765 RepID=E4Z0S9_OIKDI|nr:unnamed protein product [Oikopleura dioica]
MFLRSLFFLLVLSEAVQFCILPESPEFCTTVENGVSLRDLIAYSLQAVHDGGVILRETRNQKNLQITAKSDSSPVTFADEESNRRITSYFERNFAAVAVISEEATQTSASRFRPRSKPFRRYERAARKLLPTDVPLNSSSLTIWVDPLDATREYIQGLTEYTTVMIGIAIDGIPIAGIIHKPFLVETVLGVNLPGFRTAAHIIGKNVVLDSISHSAPKKVMHSRSHVNQEDVEIVLNEKYGFDSNDFEYMAAGGSGYKSLELVHGRAMYYIHPSNIKLWDLCAPAAILAATGGALLDLELNEINFSKDQNPLHEKGVFAVFSKQKTFVN